MAGEAPVLNALRDAPSVALLIMQKPRIQRVNMVTEEKGCGVVQRKERDVFATGRFQ